MREILPLEMGEIAQTFTVMSSSMSSIYVNGGNAGELAKYPYRLPLLVIECKMPILFLISP